MIETKRLLIKQLRISRPDIDYILARQIAWLNDKEAMQYSEQRHRAHTLDSQRAYLQSQNESFSVFEIVTKDGYESIGTMAVCFDRHNDVADLGILIGPPYRGKSLGMEAWDGLYNWLLHHRVTKIEAGFMEGNQAMYRICRRRMIYEGRRARHFIRDGQRVDLILYGSR